MKKAIVIIAIIITILSLNKQEQIQIPKEAIRFRIIANSNSLKDQNVKKDIMKNITYNKELLNYETKDLQSTKTLLEKNIVLYEKIVNSTLKKDNINYSYNITYGKNYFPEKEYKNIIYKEGNYDSLVITLGKGQGDNFWCVLFPPLCLLDMEETNTDNIEYTSYVKELIKKYF